jgi:hypothetical protein
MFLVAPFLAYSGNGNVDFRTIAWEVGSKYPAEDFLVMRTPAEWQQVWDICQGRDISDGGFPVRAPKVDFSKYMLIGVFGGRQPMAVHSVQIKNVYMEDNKVIIDIDKDGPQDNISYPMLNSPFHVVAVPKALTGAKFVVNGYSSLTMPQDIALGE